MKPYSHGATPQSAHAEFKANWKLPTRIPVPLRDRVCVEFAPYCSESPLWFPEKPTSYTAIVVYDPLDEMQPGDEIACDGAAGTQFPWEGRTLCIMERSDILLFEPAKKAA